MIRRLLIVLILFYVPSADVRSEVLDNRLHHLRIDGPREWTEFSRSSEGPRLDVRFVAERNTTEQTLRLRQQDVKQSWHVLVNGKQIGRLRVDENDMVVYFPVPRGTLVRGENTLRIEQDERSKRSADDIRVGQIELDPRPMRDVLSEAILEVDVVDIESNQFVPCRITVLDADGALHTVGASSSRHLAVRPGIVYSSTGRARFGLPVGDYTIFAGRGFEYSLDKTRVTASAGQTVKRHLAIRREVPTEGYVACDTHIHTLTHSGHGDATVEERMITIAGEGIELPITTDHNVHIDHDPFAREMNVRQYFTPVIGNEVTTGVGHFNIFPVRRGSGAPEYRASDWNLIFSEIYRTPGVKVVILNHARDLHGGTRPFGPKLHNAVVGENVLGWQFRANAMEVVNSAATQSDVMRLFKDWMGLLNRGRIITPVGSSDSHDVGRHFVGQGRTYIRCDDKDIANISVDEAVNSFIQGRVMVSYGLLAELTVDGKYGSGELAPVPDDSVRVLVRVLGPHWVNATKVQLFANGKIVREANIPEESQMRGGVKWREQWTLPKPRHDVHIVAVVLGAGIDQLYWKTAKPYQPTSPDWHPQTIGCSGAVWLDADGDGRKSTAYDYAYRLNATAAGDLAKILEGLDEYDEAIAVQAAHLYQRSGNSLLADDSQAVLKQASASAAAGFRLYLNAWRENQFARLTP